MSNFPLFTDPIGVLSTSNPGTLTTDNYGAPTFDPNANRLSVPFTKVRRGALDSFGVQDPEGFDYLLYSVFENSAGHINADQASRIELFQYDGDKVFSNESDKSIDYSEINKANAKEYINPFYLSVAEEAGYSLDNLDDDADIDDIVDFVKQGVILQRLNTTIDASINTIAGRALANTVSGVSHFIDPSLVLGAGVGAAAKGVGAGVLRASAKNTASTYTKVAGKAVSRLSASPSLSGGILGMGSRRAATFVGVDAAVGSIGFDAYAQYREGDVFERYYGERPEFSYLRSAAAGGLGLFAGAALGKALGVGKSHKEISQRIESLVDKIAPDAPASVKKQAAVSWQHNIDKLRSLIDGDESIDAGIEAHLLDDILDDLLVLYDNTDRLIDGLLPSEYLRNQINDIAEARRKFYKPVNQDDLDELNLRFEKHEEEVDALKESITWHKVEVGTRERALDQGQVDEEFVEAFQHDLDVLRQDLRNKEIELEETESSLRNILDDQRELIERERLVKDLKNEGVDTDALGTNTVGQILNILEERPTLDELVNALDPADGVFVRTAGETRAKLKKIIKRRRELEDALEAAKAARDGHVQSRLELLGDSPIAQAIGKNDRLQNFLLDAESNTLSKAIDLIRSDTPLNDASVTEILAKELKDSGLSDKDLSTMLSVVKKAEEEQILKMQKRLDLISDEVSEVINSPVFIETKEAFSGMSEAHAKFEKDVISPLVETGSIDLQGAIVLRAFFSHGDTLSLYNSKVHDLYLYPDAVATSKALGLTSRSTLVAGLATYTRADRASILLSSGIADALPTENKLLQTFFHEFGHILMDSQSVDFYGLRSTWDEFAALAEDGKVIEWLKEVYPEDFVSRRVNHWNEPNEQWADVFAYLATREATEEITSGVGTQLTKVFTKYLKTLTEYLDNIIRWYSRKESKTNALVTSKLQKIYDEAINIGIRYEKDFSPSSSTLTQRLSKHIDNDTALSVQALQKERAVRNVLDIERELNALSIEQDVVIGNNIFPEVRTTTFRHALNLKAEAANMWNRLEGTNDAVERQRILNRIDHLLDESNRMLDKTKTETVNSISQRGVTQDLLAQELSDDILARKHFAVGERSREDVRRLLESHYLEANSAIPSLHNNNVISRFIYNPYLNQISGFTTTRAPLEEISQKSPEIASAIELLSDISYTTRSMRPDKPFVPTMRTETTRFTRALSREVIKPMRRLAKKSKSHAELEQRYLEAHMLAYHGTLKTSDKDVIALAEGLKKTYQRIEAKGRRSGALKNSDPNYIAVQLKPDFETNTEGYSVFFNALADHMYGLFDPANRSGANRNGNTHRGALNLAGIISKNEAGDGWTIRARLKEGESITYQDLNGKRVTLENLNGSYDKVSLQRILKMSNLEKLELVDSSGVNDVLNLYLSNLRRGVEIDAEKAIKNLGDVSREGHYAYGSDNFNSYRAKRARNAEHNRQIPLEVIFREDVLSTGLFELDPKLNATHYWSSTGFDIAEQDLVKQLTGLDGVAFEDFVQFGIDRHQARLKERGESPLSSQHYRNIEQMLIRSRDMLAGRQNAVTEESGFWTGILKFIENSTAIPVNANVAYMMPMTEGVMPAVFNILTSGEYVTATKTFLRGFRDAFSNEQRAALGRTFDDATGALRVTSGAEGFGADTNLTYGARVVNPWLRFINAVRGVGTANSYRGNSRIGNSLVALAEAGAETTRNLSTELVQTKLGHMMFAQYHVRMLQERISRLGKAQEAYANLVESVKKSGKPASVKDLKAIARHSGIPLTDIQDYIQFGILEGVPADTHWLNEIVRNGGRDFGNLDHVYSALSRVEDPVRKQILYDRWERVLDYVNARIDRDITNPGVFDRPYHGNNAVIQAISRYLSFSRGFRSGKMKDLTNAGLFVGATALSGYYAAEVLNRSLISMWNNGESYEDIIDKWEENPDQMVFYSLSGVPIMGGGQGLVLDGLSTVAAPFTDVRAQELGLSPAAQVFSGQMRSFSNLFDGEVTEEDLRKASKSLPLVNHPISQATWNYLSDDE